MCFPDDYDDDDDDDDDDLHWVSALTVPMHLGLIDGPFVPHNLISAQESPVPLTKFQMAPRLKISVSSTSKKGTQIYYPFLSKVLAHESPPGYPMGPLWREIPITRAFLNIYSRVPSKGALHTDHLQRETLHS